MCLEGITQNVHKTLLRTILKRKREKNGGGEKQKHGYSFVMNP